MLSSPSTDTAQLDRGNPSGPKRVINTGADSRQPKRCEAGIDGSCAAVVGTRHWRDKTKNRQSESTGLPVL